MKIEAGAESLASFFLFNMFRKYIKNVLTNNLHGVKIKPRSGSDPENMEGKKMYETVKVINGYAIKRMAGCSGFYHVELKGGKFFTFRTIKAAAEFIRGL